ncbi:uncharacterized protein GBIM_21157, partial [Gryllus bimaculatus]
MAGVIRSPLQWTDVMSHFGGHVHRGVIANTAGFREPLAFLNACYVPFAQTVLTNLSQVDGPVAYKVCVSLQCDFLLDKRNPETHTVEPILQTIYLSLPHAALLTRADILGPNIGEWYFEHIRDVLNARFDEFHERESGKALHALDALHVTPHTFDPIHAS